MSERSLAIHLCVHKCSERLLTWNLLSQAPEYVDDAETDQWPSPTSNGEERRRRLLNDKESINRGVTAPHGSTKARIERAALTLFADKGVDAVTTRELAEFAGVAEGSLYRHFQNKEALAQSLYFAIHDRLTTLIQKAGHEFELIDDQVRAIVKGYCKTADEDWTLFRYHLLNTHRFLPSPNEKNAREETPVTTAESLIAAAMANGEIPHGAPEKIAAAGLGIVLQTALHKAYGRFEGLLSPDIDYLTRLVLFVIRAHADKGPPGEHEAQSSRSAAREPI